MIVAFGGRLIGFSGRVIDWDIPNTPWTFTWTGSKFGSPYPFTFDFRFLYPASITVDWGDGNIVVYNTVDQGSSYISVGRYLVSFQLNTDGSIPNGSTGHYGYLYPDGLNIQRTINLYIGNRSALYSINDIGVGNQPLNLSFAQFPALSAISFGNVIFNPLGIADITALPNLTSFSFSIVTPYFPLEVCLTHLTSLNFTIPLAGANSFLDRTFASSNMDKIPLLKSTLKSMIVGNVIKDLDGTNAFPSNWSTLQLTTLTLSGISTVALPALTGRLYFKLPSVFEGMTSLTSLSLGGISDCTNLGGLTGLTNLAINGYSGNFGGAYLPSDLPSFMSTSIPLKSVNMQGAFRASPNPQASIDTLVSNYYNYVVANASMSATNTTLPRLQTVNLNSVGGTILPTTVDADVTTKAPSGTYQQPSGYIAGSNNGAPASPMEKVWVLTNQYKITMIFAPAITGATSPLAVSIAVISSSQLRVTFSMGLTSTNGITFYYKLTYVVGGVTMVLKFNTLNILAGSTSGILNHAITTTGITQASVSIHSNVNNPLSNGTIITYTNPFTTNF